MLLDRQRPVDARAGGLPPVAVPDDPVIGVLKRLREHGRRNQRCWRIHCQAQQDRDREHEVERRQNPQYAAQPEMPQAHHTVLLEFGAHQGGYQKTAEEKEYGDAETARHETLEPGVRHEYEQETDRSQPVERRYVADWL